MLEKTIAELRAALGAASVLTGADIPARHGADWSGLPAQPPVALVLPRSTDDVSATLRICHAHRVPVTAQGGLTGLVGGARPIEGGIALSLERMRGIEEIDTATGAATVLAGTPLEAVQQAADEAGYFFALDLGARGSCTIAGNISTNAGGNRVIRYGMARELVLGLEAVLPDGTIIRSLNKMLKNNTGFDLKHLFIGSEGTLGVITRAVLRLHPKPRSVNNGLCGCADYAAVVKLLNEAKASLGGTLSSFEVMWPGYYERMLERVSYLRRPMETRCGMYVLIEAAGSDVEADQERFEAFLGRMLEAGIVVDAAVSRSEKESRALWAIRDAVAEYSRIFNGFTSFDISFPIGIMGEVTEAIERRLLEGWPDALVLPYGHIGDGNLHVVVNVPSAEPQPQHAIDEAIYAIVRRYGGAVSAEHGIGLLKKDYLEFSRSPAEIGLMRTLKAALDPHNILNPGKVF